MIDIHRRRTREDERVESTQSYWSVRGTVGPRMRAVHDIRLPSV
jgi:hypothetical protein